MMLPLDVFRVDLKDPLWLGPAETVVQALEIAQKSGTGRYMVFSHQPGHKTMYVVDLQGAVQAVGQESESRS